MDGFGARQRALEGSWYRQEEQRSLQKHAERLRNEGRLPSALAQSPQSLAASSSHQTSLLDVPTSVAGRRACEVPYQHTPSRFPGERDSTWHRLEFKAWQHYVLVFDLLRRDALEP